MYIFILLISHYLSVVATPVVARFTIVLDTTTTADTNNITEYNNILQMLQTGVCFILDIYLIKELI